LSPAKRLAYLAVSAVLWTVSVLMPQAAEAQTSALVTGTIRNSIGKPQAGATVEIFPLAAGALIAAHTAVTDQKGAYSIAALLPGEYLLRVTAPSFLPTVRNHLNLAADSKVVLNLTLNTIFRAEQMLPAKRAAGATDDDWKWTLRSSTNRAILRVLDPSQIAGEEKGDAGDGLSARLAFMAGGAFDGLGGMPSVNTDFDVKQGWGFGDLAFRGNVGYGGRDPDGALRVAYSPHAKGDAADGPEIAFLMRRATVESPHLVNSSVNTFGLSFAQTSKLLDLIDVRYGARLENSSVVGRQVYVEPLLDVAVNLGADGRLYFRQGWKGSAEDDESVVPRLSYTERGVAMERTKHEEAGYERRWNRHHFGVSYYHDTISNLALTGIGQMDMAGPDLEDEVLAGSDLESFTSNVGVLHAQGLTVRWDRQIAGNFNAGAHFDYGTVLDSTMSDMAQISELKSSLHRTMRPALGADVSVKLRRTRVESSYNMVAGSSLTPVNSTDSRTSATAPYWNLKYTQPLPSFLPAHMEAMIDIRNLLAQGYRPVVGADGRTLYLVQAPRSLRGGLAFTF
jgi:Carboxypeptidase regulatory-like domain/TonB dependent receptor